MLHLEWLQNFKAQRGRPREDLPALIADLGLEQTVLNQAWSELSVRPLLLILPNSCLTTTARLNVRPGQDGLGQDNPCFTHVAHSLMAAWFAYKCMLVMLQLSCASTMSACVRACICTVHIFFYNLWHESGIGKRRVLLQKCIRRCGGWKGIWRTVWYVGGWGVHMCACVRTCILAFATVVYTGVRSGVQRGAIPTRRTCMPRSCREQATGLGSAVPLAEQAIG